MTIKEYIDSLDKINDRFKPSGNKTLKDTMIETVSIWSNDSCKGYALQAMRNANLTDEQIKTVLTELSYSFNDLTVEEAEEKYINS